MKIGVLAGTPIDTQMGIDYVVSKGYEAIGIACSQNAKEQNEMQILHKEELLNIAIDACNKMIDMGADGIYIYCNSLSGAIDIDKLKSSISVCAVTPLDIYKMCAKKYEQLAVIAANCQSLFSIEQSILSENPDCMIFGIALLPLVVEIEATTPPEVIYEKFKIKGLTDSLSSIGCQALILGCTHFPYLEKEISQGVNVPVINPSDKMLEYLVSKNL